MDKKDKTYRILKLYDKLIRGDLINKSEMAQQLGIDKKVFSGMSGISMSTLVREG